MSVIELMKLDDYKMMNLTGEVDAADRVHVVVHVGRMATSLAAVAARELGLRALHADAQPVPASLARGTEGQLHACRMRSAEGVRIN